jgi:olefin beta-lactone synthetase
MYMTDAFATGNFSELIIKQAQLHADKYALIVPDYNSLDTLVIKDKITYAALADRIARFATLLRRSNIGPGDRVILIIPLSADFYALTLAIMSLGAVPVFIDSSLPGDKMLKCIALAKPKGIISLAGLLKYSWYLPMFWKIPVKFTFIQDSMGIKAIAKLADKTVPSGFTVKEVEPDSPALITFTADHKGVPKGVNRTHEVLTNQHHALKQIFPPQEGQVDMPAFPVIALHNLCCGNTTVLPLVNFKAIGEPAPAILLEQIKEFGVTTLSGTPAFLRTLVNYCLEHDILLNNIKRLVIGGGPVESMLCLDIINVFSNVDGYVLYSASEAEPIAYATLKEVLAKDQYRTPGYCVGAPASTVELALLAVREIASTDLSHSNWLEKVAQAGEMGEIVVTGKHVCKNYFESPAADKSSKLQDDSGRIWHRTGDIGFRDEQGNVWLTGRREGLFAINNEVYFPYQIEKMLNKIEEVRKAAVISPVKNLCVICLDVYKYNKKAEVQIIRILKDHFKIENIKVLLFDELPVDARHNSKIDYPALEKMALEKLKNAK